MFSENISSARAAVSYSSRQKHPLAQVVPDVAKQLIRAGSSCGWAARSPVEGGAGLPEPHRSETAPPAPWPGPAELGDADAVLLYNYGVSQHVKTWIDFVTVAAG
ncbi:hypothetical protein ABZ801_36060 [Actinomadura sp. NPDC047616]|uniref:hypothetical protein n=1 Tax=Actinomadura sp. NPDC047616 TaxID=3155914 RepID=UPI0033E819E8